MSAVCNITPEQKKSLIRVGLIFYFAALLWPLVHQVMTEQLELVPGSFANAFLVSLKIPIRVILLHGIFFQIQRAIGMAEGTWGRRSDESSSAAASSED